MSCQWPELERPAIICSRIASLATLTKCVYIVHLVIASLGQNNKCAAAHTTHTVSTNLSIRLWPLRLMYTSARYSQPKNCPIQLIGSHSLVALARWKSNLLWPWPLMTTDSRSALDSQWKVTLIQPFRSITQQFATFAQCWPNLATNIDLRGQIHACHLDHSAKLPRLAPLLSCTWQNVVIA